MTPNIHDELAKEMFSRPDEARTLLRSFLPGKHLRAIELDSLRLVQGSVVDRRLRGRHSDLLFSVNTSGGEALVFLLFEHKSYQDRWLMLQLFIYVGRIWARYRREHGDGCRLPMILTVVLYHGRGAWDRPLRLVDLCQSDETSLALLGPEQPALPVTLIDLSTVSEQRVRSSLRKGTALATLTLLLMKTVQSGRILDRLRSWAPIVRRARVETGGLQMLELLLCYLMLATREEVEMEDLEDVLSDVVGDEAEDLVMNYAQRLFQQGKAEGRAEGKAEGKAEGALRGMRQAVTVILQKRFGTVPDAIRTRMEAADLETLQRWHERAILAPSIGDVFAD